MISQSKFEVDHGARVVRQVEFSRLLQITTAAITDWLRQRHEVALRRPQRPVRMRSANATPV